MTNRRNGMEEAIQSCTLSFVNGPICSCLHLLMQTLLQKLQMGSVIIPSYSSDYMFVYAYVMVDEHTKVLGLWRGVCQSLGALSSHEHGHVGASAYRGTSCDS